MSVRVEVERRLTTIVAPEVKVIIRKEASDRKMSMSELMKRALFEYLDLDESLDVKGNDYLKAC